jgi:hypothetical protein
MNIIELAEQAGFAVFGWNETEFKKFADLVAAQERADEREECVRKASIALLGADKALTDRVLKAIRARGTT